MSAPGPMEILIVIAVGLVVIGIPIAVIACLIFMFTRRGGDQASTSGDPETVTKLLRENESLRAEIAQLKAKYGEPPPQ